MERQALGRYVLFFESMWPERFWPCHILMFPSCRAEAEWGKQALSLPDSGSGGRAGAR